MSSRKLTTLLLPSKVAGYVTSRFDANHVGDPSMYFQTLKYLQRGYDLWLVPPARNFPGLLASEVIHSDTARTYGINNMFTTPTQLHWYVWWGWYVYKPIKIAFPDASLESGFRSSPLNTKLRELRARRTGMVDNFVSSISQHMGNTGAAGDFTRFTRAKNLTMFRWMRANLGSVTDQLISEKVDKHFAPKWVHISVGPQFRKQVLYTTPGGKFYNYPASLK